MNKGIKYALVFISGTSVGLIGGISVVIYKSLKSDIIREALSKALADKIDNVLFGRDGKYVYRERKVSYVNYRDMCKPSSYDIGTPVFKSRVEALDVRDKIDDIIKEYGYATVSDLYELMGLESSYIDNKYGWKSSSDFEVKKHSQGFILKTPKALPID